MIDLHCHCLPGLDDGPESLDQALAICRAAAEDGCKAIIATPHQRLGEWWNCEPRKLEDLRAELNANLGGFPKVHPGAEVRIDLRLLEDLDAPDRSGILPLADSRYLLLEYPRGGAVGDPEELIYELGLVGWIPILAHPEFIIGLGDDVDFLARLVNAGALVQITAASVTGRFGRAAQRTTDRMLDRGLVHFVASDAHDTRYRPPGLREAARHIEKNWSSELADRLTRENPLHVLENRDIPPAFSTSDLSRSSQA